MGDHIFSLDLFEMTFDFLAQCHTLLTTTHELFNLLKVLFLTAILAVLGHLDVGTAISLSHVFYEVGAITNGLALQRVDEGAITLIEAVRAADLLSKCNQI